MSTEIEQLNEEIKCTLGRSLIHGIGVIALRDIKKGEKLYCSFNPHSMYSVSYAKLNEVRPEIKSIILARYPTVINGDKFLSPNDDQILTSFMNHSDNPNYKDDIALRNIRQGEEITENYRQVPHHLEIYPFLSLI